MKNNNIEQMFSRIVSRYDFLNHLLSLNRDKFWRRFAIDRLISNQGEIFLDLATGTADVAIEISERKTAKKIFAVDFSRPMLNFARKKIKKINLDQKIFLGCADALNLPFPEKTFDGIVIAFALRNFPDREKGLKEMFRVLKDDGKLVILEFTTPPNKIFRNLYFSYLSNILPHLGQLISEKEAYQYLADTIKKFPRQEELKLMLENTGFKGVGYYNVTFGTVAVHEGIK